MALETKHQGLAVSPAEDAVAIVSAVIRCPWLRQKHPPQGASSTRWACLRISSAGAGTKSTFSARMGGGVAPELERRTKDGEGGFEDGSKTAPVR